MTKGKAPKILCADPRSFAKNLLNSPKVNGIEYQPKWWIIIMFLVKFLPKKIIAKL